MKTFAVVKLTRIAVLNSYHNGHGFMNVRFMHSQMEQERDSEKER